MSGGVFSSPTLSVNPSIANPFPLFSIGTSFSYSFWLNPAVQSGSGSSSVASRILAVQTTFASVEPLACDNDIVEFTVPSRNPGITQCNVGGVQYSAIVTPGVWQHLAFTYDGQGDFAFYLNGSAVTGVLPGSSTSFTPQARGSVGHVYLNPYFDGDVQATLNLGAVSTLRVYSTALTPCQVQSDFNGLRQENILAEYISTISASGQQLPDVINQQSSFSCSSAVGCSAQTSSPSTTTIGKHKHSTFSHNGIR